MIYFSHPTGNQNVRHALKAFSDENALGLFATEIATFPNNFWDFLSKTPFGAELSRRSFDPAIRSKTTQTPCRELGRILSSKLRWHWLTQQEKGIFCIDQVYRSLDKKVAKKIRSVSGKQSLPQAVYAYEDGALESFRAARQRNISCLYDLPIGYWREARRIQLEESNRLPDWAATMPTLIDSDEKVARKDDELKLADQIIVASSFTAETLKQAPFALPDPVVIPYGCPVPTKSEAESDQSIVERWEIGGRSAALRVLFVGGLSQRKGIAYLLDAMELVKNSCDLTIIGRKPDVACRPLEEGLKKHRWIASLPHEKILEEMREHDVLVFPSLFEGFGLVITEALASGLPVITTPHTCGPDVLTEGRDGFIVPVRNAALIAEKLEILYSDRDLLLEMSTAALEKARMITWNGYRSELVRQVLLQLSKKPNEF